MTFVFTVPAPGSNVGLIFDFEPDGGTDGGHHHRGQLHDAALTVPG